MSTCYFYAMHNGFEPPTGGSKFGEHREQQIWEKQSGGLFRSDCAILGIPSSVPITGRYLLISTCYFYTMHNGFEPPTGGSKFGEHREQQIWEKQSGGLFRSDCAILGIPSSVPSVPITRRYRRLCRLRSSVQILLRQYRPGTGARQPAPSRPQLAVFAGRQSARRRHPPSRPNRLAGSPAAPGILKEEAV